MHRGVASVWAMPRLLRIPARYAHTSGVNVVGARVTRKQLVFPGGLQSTSVVRGPRYLRFLCQGRDSLWVSKFNVQGSWYG